VITFIVESLGRITLAGLGGMEPNAPGEAEDILHTAEGLLKKKKSPRAKKLRLKSKDLLHTGSSVDLILSDIDVPVEDSNEIPNSGNLLQELEGLLDGQASELAGLLEVQDSEIEEILEAEKELGGQNKVQNARPISKQNARPISKQNARPISKQNKNTNTDSNQYLDFNEPSYFEQDPYTENKGHESQEEYDDLDTPFTLIEEPSDTTTNYAQTEEINTKEIHKDKDTNQNLWNKQNQDVGGLLYKIEDFLDSQGIVNSKKEVEGEERQHSSSVTMESLPQYILNSIKNRTINEEISSRPLPILPEKPENKYLFGDVSSRPLPELPSDEDTDQLQQQDGSDNKPQNPLPLPNKRNPLTRTLPRLPADESDIPRAKKKNNKKRKKDP